MRASCVATIATLALAALLSATGAAAVDMVVSANLNTEYNSNYLGLEEDPRYSVRSLIGPTAAFRHSNGRLAYDVVYFGSYSFYLQPSRDSLNKWEQSVRGLIEYDLSPRTKITVLDSFHDQVAIRFTEIEQDDLTDTLDGGRDPFLRNSFALTVEHAFSPRVAGSLFIQNEWVNFKRNIRQNDSVSMGVAGQLTYAVTRADRLGFGGAFSYQVYKELDFRVPGSRGRIYNVYGLWEHRFSKDFRVSLSAGPTVIETDVAREVQVTNFGFRVPDGAEDLDVLQFVEFDSSCVVVPGSSVGLESACGSLSPPLPVADGPPLALVQLPFVGSNDTDQRLTFFGRFTLARDFDNLALRISYNRSQSNAAGDGGTSTLDRILLRADYAMDSLWSFYGSASWARRERVARPVFAADFLVVDGGPVAPGFARRTQVVEGRGSRNAGNDQVTLILGTRRRLTRKLFGSFSFQYRYQLNSRSNQQDRKVQFFLLNARFNYDFDPVRL